MKRSVRLIFFLLMTCLFFLSCKKRSDDSWSYHVLSIECESMIEKCGNGPGLRFNSEKTGNWIEPAGEEGHFEKIPFHYTICCENVPAFIDKMKYADSSRRAWIRDKPDFKDGNFTVDGNTEIRVYYGKNFSNELYSFMWFGHPTEAPVINVDLDEFDKLVKDIEEKFRTCCLK